MNQQQPSLGLNKTGIQMSPLLSKEMLEAADQFPWANHSPSLQPGAGLEESYQREAHAIGSIPVPLTVKGVAKSGFEKLKGERPELFVDKLGERLAFERTGCRLYESLMRKCTADPHRPASVSLTLLEQIHQQELDHMFLVKKSLEAIGADPTAMTPAADVVAVASSGLLQVVSDPRTSIAHAFEAVLLAELADHDGWNLLVQLAAERGEEAMAQEFQTALRHEASHVQDIRSILRSLTLGASSTAGGGAVKSESAKM